MPDNIREIFVKNLHYLMDARGITQADICRELNVSSATASDWYNGKKYPRVDAIQHLADLLGVMFSTLTTENGIRDYEDLQIVEALHKHPKLRNGFLIFIHTGSEHKVDSGPLFSSIIRFARHSPKIHILQPKTRLFLTYS